LAGITLCVSALVITAMPFVRSAWYIDEARLLPDALLFDGGPGTFWLVEAVYTAGAIDEGRKAALAEWAESQGLDPAKRAAISRRSSVAGMRSSVPHARSFI